MMVSLIGGIRRDVPQEGYARRGILVSARLTAFCNTSPIGVLDLQPNGPNEFERLMDYLIRHLRFADDVVEQRLRVGTVGDRGLPLEQPCHHFDPRKRVLDFVRDGRRHLPKRHEPVPQTLASSSSSIS